MTGWGGSKRRLQCAMEELVSTGYSTVSDVTGVESDLMVEGGVDFFCC